MNALLFKHVCLNRMVSWTHQHHPLQQSPQTSRCVHACQQSALFSESWTCPIWACCSLFASPHTTPVWGSWTPLGHNACNAILHYIWSCKSCADVCKTSATYTENSYTSDMNYFDPNCYSDNCTMFRSHFSILTNVLYHNRSERMNPVTFSKSTDNSNDPKVISI